MDDRVIQGLEFLPGSARGGVLTIGNFDGVHVGHQRIIAAAGEIAGADGLPVVAMTFEPPPDLVVRPDDPPRRLTPPDQKADLLRRAGADWVLFVAADRELLAMEPDEFIQRMVRQLVSPRHVVEGPDFFFGRERAGTVETLRAAGVRGGFDVHVVEAVTVELPAGPERVCSTLIRNLISAGEVAPAAKCLGRPFALYGEIVAGHGRGRSLGFPTTNITAGEQVSPADGIYAGQADIDGRTFAAAISVGNAPTFAEAARVVEAHLLDVNEDFYGRFMTLRFVARLRSQQRFDGPAALSAQIAKDVERVREICQRGV